MVNSLSSLLEHLDTRRESQEHEWQGWRVAPIDGGANNLLYRATCGDEDYAIKFTVRDERRRAWREYMALTVLNEAGIDIAPHALWLDEDSYRQPVVVQTWLAGACMSGPPQTDEEWEALLAHYCTIHTLTPDCTAVTLLPAVLTMYSASAGKRLIADHVARLPLEAQPASLQRILMWFDAWHPAEWPAAPPSLCHTDPNWRNHICRPDGIVSVDWENSGWGDPAFEIADLMTHPAYDSVDEARWEWLAPAYAQHCHDATVISRIRTYRTMMQVWWVVRGARYLYEAPRGLDERLVARPPDWQAEMERKYARFVERAERTMESAKKIHGQ